MLNSQRAYENKDYWLQLIEREAQIWENGFLNTELKNDAIFLYTVFIDYNKGFLRSRWAHYPNIESLQGFMTNVFMPTAIFQLLDNYEDAFMMPLASSEEILEYMGQLDKIDESDLECAKELLSLYEELTSNSPKNKTTLDKLQLFSEAFNHLCDGHEKLIYFNVFKSPNEVRDFVRMQTEDGVEGLVEEELGMSLASWDDMCENVYSNAFFNKRFTTILNSKMSCLI